MKSYTYTQTYRRLYERAPMHTNLPPLLSSACGLTLLSECKQVWKHDLGSGWWNKDVFKWGCLFFLPLVMSPIFFNLLLWEITLMLGQCLIVTLISQGTTEEVLPALFYPLCKNAKPFYFKSSCIISKRYKAKTLQGTFCLTEKTVFPGTFQDDAYIYCLRPACDPWDHLACSQQSELHTSPQGKGNAVVDYLTVWLMMSSFTLW